MTTNKTAQLLIPFRSSGFGPHALLFIHGFMDAGAVWDPLISAITTDLQKITIDLPGMGELNSYEGELSLKTYAKDVAGLVREIGKPVVIVAQSMGAQIAELAAVAEPSFVKGLVFLTPVPLGGVNAPPEAIAPFKKLGGQADLQRQARRNLSHALSPDGEVLLGRIGDLVKPHIVGALVDIWNNGDPLGAEPSKFSGPVLIIGGTSDPFVTEEMVGAIASRFAHVDRTAVAEAGHWIHVEQPGRVAALIDSYLRHIEWSPVGSGAADWKEAFAKRNASAFADAFASDVVLEAAVLFEPIRGRENVKRVMEAASKLYESLKFTDQAVEGLRQYVEWEARAFGGIELWGVTVITRNDSGEIHRLAIHHRPLGAALKFSAELGQRLHGSVDASHFLRTDDLPPVNRS